MPNNAKATSGRVRRDSKSEPARRRSRGRGAKNSRRDAAPSHIGQTATRSIWEHALGDHVSEARTACLQGLTKIPSGVGRLAYLAMLQRQLLEDHEELFGEWPFCSLQQKYEWITRLLANAKDAGTPVQKWLDPATYSELIPSSVGESEKKLFLAEFAAVLDILEKEAADTGNSSPWR